MEQIIQYICIISSWSIQYSGYELKDKELLFEYVEIVKHKLLDFRKFKFSKLNKKSQILIKIQLLLNIK